MAAQRSSPDCWIGRRVVTTAGPKSPPSLAGFGHKQARRHACGTCAEMKARLGSPVAAHLLFATSEAPHGVHLAVVGVDQPGYRVHANAGLVAPDVVARSGDPQISSAGPRPSRGSDQLRAGSAPQRPARALRRSPERRGPRCPRKAVNASIPRRCASLSEWRSLPAALRLGGQRWFCVRSTMRRPALAICVLLRLAQATTRQPVPFAVARLREAAGPETTCGRR